PEPIATDRNKSICVPDKQDHGHYGHQTSGNKSKAVPPWPAEFHACQLKEPPIGCRLSIKTANANSQSSDDGFSLRSCRYAAFPSAHTRSRLVFLGTSTVKSALQIAGPEGR